MNDQSKFINTYIDVIVGQLHEVTGQLLQTKTQIRLHGDIVAEKDNNIESLSQQLIELKSKLDEAVNSNNQNDENLKKIEAINNENTNLKNKLNHMDSLMRSLGDMKLVLNEKESGMNRIREENTNLRSEIENKNVRITRLESEVTQLKVDLDTKQTELNEINKPTKKKNVNDTKGKLFVINKTDSEEEKGNDF